jgi:hypothetical protein
MEVLMTTSVEKKVEAIITRDAQTGDMVFANDVHLIWSRKVPLVIVNHEVINIMSPIGSLVIV